MKKIEVHKSSTKKDKVWKGRGYRIVDMELGDDMNTIIYMYEKEKEEGIKKS